MFSPYWADYGANQDPDCRGEDVLTKFWWVFGKGIVGNDASREKDFWNG
jgi:hypothetical protein